MKTQKDIDEIWAISEAHEKRLQLRELELDRLIEEYRTKANSYNAIQLVSERFLLVEWIEDNPCIDGANYFDSMEECLKYVKSLPEAEGMKIERTICRINAL